MTGSIIVISLGEKKLSFYNNKIMHNDVRCQCPTQQELPMPSFKREITLAAIGFMAALVVPFVAHALPSTATGQISVGQVMEMIEKAGTSPIARQTLIAYVAGVGEAAGAIVDAIGNGSRTVSCRKSFSLDTGAVRAALEAGAPREDSWSQTPATPLIVADMVKRAGCRAKD
jgi:hypothetical protein